MKYSTIKSGEKVSHYIVSNCQDTLETAVMLKKNYHQPRLISIDGSIITAIKAAYRTASGLYSEAQGEIAKSIYQMTKLDVALLITKNDSSDEALDRAAYELAQDAFVTGKLEERAEALAAATGRAPEACLALIMRKLISMTEKMNACTSRLLTKGETPESPEAIKNEILKTGGRFMLCLPTAYGKTSIILEPVMRSYIEQGKKVLVITHRRSINKNIAQIEGMVSYDECTSPDIIASAKGLKIVVNSLSAQKYKDFIESADLVVIDEASQVISHVLGGEVKHRQDVWNALNACVKNAKNVIMADADINARCASMIGPEARLFKIEQSHSDITVSTADIDHVRGLVVEAVKEGKKALIACDVAKDAQALAKVIAKKTGKTPLVITADSARWYEQAAFIADPDSTKQHVVIYSPVITSALSITTAHFDAHFGLFQGSIVPSDAIQMLRRDRTAKTFTVGMKNPDYRKAEMVEVKFRKGLVKVEEILRGMGISEDMKEKIREAVKEDTKLSSFDALQYDHNRAEAWLKDNIQNSLPATLLAQGFKIEVLERNERLAKDGFADKSQGLKAVKKEVVEKLLEAKAASEAVVKTVEEAGSKDEAEQVSVSRARAQQVMKREVLTEADAKLWGAGEGEAKIARFKKIFDGLEYENELGDVAELIRKAVREMAEGKDWTVDSSAELFDKLNSQRCEVIDAGFKISTATSKQGKQLAISSIMRELGLKTKKKDGGKSGIYYIITPESLELMQSY
jgi:hypothetical protein